MNPSSTTEHIHALPTGTLLAEYELQQVLGSGGFGIVYLAYDHLLDQHVVIKEYLPAQHATRMTGNTVTPLHSKAKMTFEWGLQRFLDEAKALAVFRQHPHIVSVLRYFEANQTAYMVMEFAGETSLQDYLTQQQTLTAQELQILLIPLLDALETIHAAGLIHRDLKPSNILIHKRQPLLIDFGSARHALGDKTQNLTEVISQGYSPLEQYDSHSHQGAWTDIYALAGVLYRCVTGREPAEATARLMEDRLLVLADDAALVETYGQPLLAAIDWGLQIKPENRPASVAAWRTRLLAEPSTVVTQPEPALHTPSVNPAVSGGNTWVKRHVAAVLAGGLLGLSGLGMAAHHYWSVTPTTPVAVTQPVLMAMPVSPSKSLETVSSVVNPQPIAELPSSAPTSQPPAAAIVPEKQTDDPATDSSSNKPTDTQPNKSQVQSDMVLKPKQAQKSSETTVKDSKTKKVTTKPTVKVKTVKKRKRTSRSIPEPRVNKFYPRSPAYRVRPRSHQRCDPRDQMFCS